MSTPSHYFVLEIPDDRRVTAIAEETALNDFDLDALEKLLVNGGCTASEIGSAALTLGRCGRSSSQSALQNARRSLPAGSAEAHVIDLALALLDPQPHSVERADAGYRFVGADGAELFVEDPLAAYWHRRDRWGPPIRPDARRTVVARAGATAAELADLAEAGHVVLVIFRPERWWAKPEPPLRVTCAGVATDPALASLVRWPKIRSVGRVERRGRVRVGIQRADVTDLWVLPGGAGVGVSVLLDLFSRMLARAHGEVLSSASPKVRNGG